LNIQGSLSILNARSAATSIKIQFTIFNIQCRLVRVRTPCVTNNEAIVNPQKTASSPDLGPVAVMAATGADLYHLCELAGYARKDYHRLFMSRLYCDRHNPERFSITGPFVGAPYAVMLLENLIAWGARQIIFVGWCGAISSRVKIGDIILPTSGFSDEGTSTHYGTAGGAHYQADFPLLAKVRQVLAKNNCDFHEGAVWTTDAIYRETRDAVFSYQQQGVLAVEMEVSALYAVARFRRADLAGILVVSDELSSSNWRPGFKQDRFVQGRKIACRLVTELLGGF
jgi:purine-nucleoside phosphorylase